MTFGSCKTNFAFLIPDFVYQRDKPIFFSNLSVNLVCLFFYSPSVHGNWASWASWGSCTVTCGGGTKDRSRTCTNPAPQYLGNDCVGSGADRTDCNTHHCPSKLTAVFGEISPRRFKQTHRGKSRR